MPEYIEVLYFKHFNKRRRENVRPIEQMVNEYNRNPDDDLVLEVAVEGGSVYIVTHNIRRFSGIEQLGVTALTPRQLWEKTGALS